MLCGYVPFKAPSIPELYKLILKGKYTAPSHLSTEAADLIRRMLNIIPENRISIK
jgi:5'-AMP-activated protein kinase catalytic alpha subunit